MVQSVASRFTQSDGRTLETAVFLSLRRRGLEIAYHRTRSGKEVDFVHRDDAGRTGLVQVCWDMGEEGARSREIAALEEAIRELRPREARIVTAGRPEELVLAGAQVEVVPAWRYLITAGA